jgi:hypothetical protein
MGNYLSMIKPNTNVNVNVNVKYEFDKFNKYNEPLKYNVNIIKPFTPRLKTIYE